MASETWSFASRDELIDRLKARDWRQDFKKAHDDVQDFGPLTAVYHSVGSSTFRAFRVGKHSTPSEVFRSWAGRELAERRLSELLSVRSSGEYRDWAVHSAKSLQREWKRKLAYVLETPRALKLINLLAKGLCIVAPLWPERYETLVWNIDVPLDKYTLRPLACIPQLASVGISWRTASMGSVRDLKTYEKIQQVTQSVCEKAGVPPLSYDFLAWDVPHESELRKGKAGQEW